MTRLATPSTLPPTPVNGTTGLPSHSQLARELAAMPHLRPAQLARLLRPLGGDGPHAQALRHVVQNDLMARTLRRARRHVPYYRPGEYPTWSPGAPGEPPDLEALPILHRQTVVERFDEFLADDLTLRSICHTSGTTGTPLDLYKSHEEIDYILAFYRSLFAPLVDGLATRPLILTLPNVNHGVPVPMPGIGFTFVGGVTDDTLIEDARRLLGREFKIKGHDRRISLLSGLPHHVLLLTSYLCEQGVDVRALGMAGVTVTGGYLSMHWLRLLAELWGCVVHDRFTLTESIGGASRLPGTDVYVLDPHIIGEVVDPGPATAASERVGVLALTNLYPFVQMQPMIRYTVGDAVRRLPGPGPLRFQFLGKERNCVSWTRDGRREWLLFSASLHDALTELPDVAVHEWFANVRVVHDRTIGSLPIASVETRREHDAISIRIAIELRYAPHTRPARLAEMRRAITEALERTPDTALAIRRRSGEARLEIDFVGPSALQAPLAIKI